MILTEKNKEIISWFESHQNPILGELYRGALRIFSEENFPGYLQFISHAVREIRNRIPYIILGDVQERFEWTKELKNLEDCWRKAEVFSNRVTEEEQLEEAIPVSLNVCKEIDQILDRYRKNNETYENKMFRLFKFLQNRKTSEEVLRPIVLHWKAVTKWFEKKVHIGEKTSNIGIDEIKQKFIEFERMLYALQGNIYSGMDDLDEILEETNRSTS